MKIIDMLRQEKPSLSFEVFPPKAADKYLSLIHISEPTRRS